MLNAQNERTGRPRRKVAVIATVAALAAGGIGIGALVTYQTAIEGNHFQATVGDGEVEGALLQLSGDALVHEFDTAVYNDAVEGTWTLTNAGTSAVTYDGTLAPVGAMSDTLAQNLEVYYGEVGTGGATTAWRAAGTLAAPVSYADALALGEATIDADEVRTIPIRVVLADPTALAGEIGDLHDVKANFTVEYLAPGA
jgi:hypothetical protein